MLKNCWKPSAVIGLTLTALSLNGLWGTSAASSITVRNSSLTPEICSGNTAGKQFYARGSYLKARALFLDAALLSQHGGDLCSAAMNWNNAGGSALARLDYRDALADFLKARQAAQASRESVPLAMTMNNLASLYVQMGKPAAAVRIAREALAGPARSADPSTRAKLRFQLASALAHLNRFDEAEGIYLAAVDELKEQGDLDSTARILASLGAAALEADRVDDAEAALSEALMLVRVHRLTASANVLRGLAEVRDRKGDSRSAESLFDAAIAAPQSLTPRWVLYADRGRFKLDHSDLSGALADFREARRIAALMRADIVPADQDRVGLEGDLSRVDAGLVDAGNRLARQTGERALLGETFDAAEQDRLWSLRALLPASNDWRTRLPESYWDLLTRYQSTERTLVNQPTAELRGHADALQLELQEAEAIAASDPRSERAQSALEHVRSVLDPGSVLFSFYFTKSGGWLWAVDRTGVDVYAIPSMETLRARVAQFTMATKGGTAQAAGLGNRLYRDLFGSVLPGIPGSQTVAPRTGWAIVRPSFRGACRKCGHAKRRTRLSHRARRIGVYPGRSDAVAAESPRQAVVSSVSATPSITPPTSATGEPETSRGISSCPASRPRERSCRRVPAPGVRPEPDFSWGKTRILQMSALLLMPIPR